MLSVLGPLSRLLALLVCFAWVPVLIVAYIQWRLKGSPTQAPRHMKVNSSQHDGKKTDH